jgi:nucleoside-diphosphate-sugar epimerase
MSVWDGSFAQGDLRDRGFAAEVTENVRAVVHLAGNPRPDASWDEVVEANVLVTASLCDAAAANGAPKIIYASSVHVVGAYNDPKCWPVSPTWPVRPCCRYGVSKATGELIGQGYARTVPGSSVIVLRLPLIAERPRWTAESRAWLSAPDLVQLILAALRADARSGTYFATSLTVNPRYDSGAAVNELGFAPVVAGDLDDLPSTPPPYADNCVLWKLSGR